MDTATATKPNDGKSSREIAQEGRNLADLLGSHDLGVKVKGVVMVVEEPAPVSGTSAKGRAYSFISRRFQLFTGKGNAVCAETHDKMEDFKPLPLFSLQEFEVESARMDGSQLVLRIDTKV